ncbi:MAG TPA: WD40 repeat domain-containing protein [Candidatus Poseidoniales archaeon]|nr:MAG TPA: WD40 repeat domain-containing protein [Candidatus Poseidoniales archaeon]HII49715.1 WD40 repeat domain-containing protein [Candidatus Poseidoniaceae archaeon]
MYGRRNATLIVVIFAIMCAPIANASSSGMNFIETTVSNKSDARINSVTVNENSTIIASSYGTYVEFHNTTTLDLIERFNFGKEIYHIEFSPSGKDVAVSLVATQAIPDSIQLIDVEQLVIKDKKSRGNDRPGNLDWSPNGTRIVVPNMNNGAQVLDSSSMNELFLLNGVHTSDVTCVSFSKTGNYIITGDENGKLKLWDNEGEPQNLEIEVGEEITGCDFSSMDAKIAFSTKSGNIFSYTLTGTSLQSRDLGDNYGLKWSQNNDILYVLNSDNKPKLLALDGSTFEIIHSTSLLHKSLDFSMEESNGLLSKFYVATDTNHVAIYGTPTYPNGYGLMGSDLDGDNIPDTFDLDDDGDSFLDDWDFNCLNSTICSREPDLQTIRSMVIDINENTLIIEDVYTMSLIDTYIFRNLTRKAIIADDLIGYDETNLIENAFCDNMDKNDYVQKLRSSIELSVGQVTNGTINCEIIDGLLFTQTLDKEQLKFRFKTIFDVSPNVTLPLSVTINQQISVIDSSITHMVENHPILIQQIDTDGALLYTLWWNSDVAENPKLNFTDLEKEESKINSFVKLVEENQLIIGLFLCSSIILLWLIVRWRNLSSVILDDSEFEDSSDDLNEDYEQNYNQQLQVDSEDISIDNSDNLTAHVNDEPIIAEAIPGEQRPIDRRAFTLTDNEEFVEQKDIKRRTGRTQRNAQGPIMSTKRKRLDGKLDIPGEKIISKKTSVKKVVAKKVRKVRSVKKDNQN